MLAWSLETQADQRNTRATLYDVGVGSEGELWRLVGVTVPEGQPGEKRFSYTCRGTGGDQWGWGESLVVVVFF